jgi:hypothetical protein
LGGSPRNWQLLDSATAIAPCHYSRTAVTTSPQQPAISEARAAVYAIPAVDSNNALMFPGNGRNSPGPDRVNTILSPRRRHAGHCVLYVPMPRDQPRHERNCRK